MEQIDQTSLIVAGVISAIILFVIITLAVSNAIGNTLKHIQNELKISNRMKLLDLKKQGVTDAEIKAEVDKVYK